MKKKMILSGKLYFYNKKELIFKNSINYVFLKKLKYYFKKNLFYNFFFYNIFINFYKKHNLNFYLLKFFNFNNNLFYIYNVSNFKKQFQYDLNFIKVFFKKKKTNFLFAKKNLIKSCYYNNCYLISNDLNSYNFIDDCIDFFLVLSTSKNNIFIFKNNFINFNLFIFNMLEFYKLFIILYIKILIKY